MKEIGEIESIFRYPVKSIKGEKLSSSVVDENGLEGDRVFAFKDCETGFIASCKHPRKWEKIIELSATINQINSVVIRDVNDNELVGKEEIESKIYELTSRRVELISVKDSHERQIREADRSRIEKLGAEIKQEPLSVASKENHFFDFAPLHIITDSSLNHIRTFNEKGDFNVQRFRPNLVIKTTGSDGFVENEWLGKEIKIGADLQIKIIEPTPRCALVTLKQRGMKKDTEVLKTIVQNSSAESYTYFPGMLLKGTLGVYAIITKNGSIKVGDKVQIIEK